jgi:2'-5' RNA ligase
LIAEYARAWLGDAGKQTRELDLHITLNFLGKISVEDMQRVLAIVVPPVQPFTVRIDKPALWHDGLAVLEASSAELLELQRSIDAELKRLDLPREDRPYRPHVTLARKAVGVQQLASFIPMSWSVDSYCLMESAAGGESRYSVLRRYPAVT